MSQATKRRILEAAMACLAEQSFSLRLVAKRAGVTKATIGHYYGTKEQLRASCVLARFDQFHTQVLRPALPIKDREQSLKQIAMTACARARYYRGETQSLLELILTNEHAHIHDLFWQRMDRSVELLAPALGLDEQRVRVILHQLAMHIVRHAVATTEELIDVFGGDAAEAETRSAQAVAETFIAMVTPSRRVREFFARKVN